MAGTRFERTSIHEAGHAVAAVAVGRRVEYATIVPNQDHSGHVKYGDVPTSLSTDDILNYMVISLAGVKAEHRAGYRPRRWQWRGDWEAAMNGASELSSGDSEQHRLFFLIAMRRTDILVEWHWQAITQIAAILRSQKIMTEDDIRALVIPPIQDGKLILDRLKDR